MENNKERKAESTMQWSKQDLERYMKAKEYVDTLIVPLLPYQLSQESTLDQDAFQGEVLHIFTKAIEKELTGRILLTPPYSYLRTKDLKLEVERLNTWVEDALTQPFAHVFFITFETNWKKHEPNLNGSLVWLPVTQTENIHSKEMRAFIQSQVSQISELIKSYWE